MHFLIVDIDSAVRTTGWKPRSLGYKSRGDNVPDVITTCNGQFKFKHLKTMDRRCWTSGSCAPMSCYRPLRRENTLRLLKRYMQRSLRHETISSPLPTACRGLSLEAVSGTREVSMSVHIVRTSRARVTALWGDNAREQHAPIQKIVSTSKEPGHGLCFATLPDKKLQEYERCTETEGYTKFCPTQATLSAAR